MTPEERELLQASQNYQSKEVRNHKKQIKEIEEELRKIQ